MVIYGSVPVSDYFEHLHKKKNKIVLVHVIELPDMAHAREYSWAIGENKSECERGETSLPARRPRWLQYPPAALAWPARGAC